MAVMAVEKPHYPAPLMPQDRDWTVDDLGSLPDDGLRYELVDGMLVVTPAPTVPHQVVVVGLVVVLHAACPDDLQVVVSPIDYRPDRRRSLQPDVAVIRRSAAAEKNLVEAPLLVVEVLSPSTRRYDATVKRSVYEESGVSSYWLFDPTDPALLISDLVDGHFVDVAKAVGPEVVHVERPFPIRLCPAELARGGHRSRQAADHARREEAEGRRGG